MATDSTPTGLPGIPPVLFAPVRGARIAYQDFGEGPVLVSIPPFAQNIEVAWDWPPVREMFERFGSFSRSIIFDKRGTGASDRQIPIANLDERVEDLRAVMDHAGVERAFLFGASEGGPMCLLFAATYPDRVDGVVIHGSGAYIVPPADVDAAARSQAFAGFDYLVQTWGTPQSPMAEAFSPSLAGDDDYRTWLERYCRLSATQESCRELLDMVADFDVRDVLAEIKAPVLVQHRTGDRIVSVDHGRALAGAIDGAELCEYDSDDHFSFVGDLGWIDDIERFVTGSVKDRPPRSTETNVTVTTLGRFGAQIDGQEVPTSMWRSRIPRQICKRLVAARGWPVTREKLFEMCWPDETDTAKLGARLSVQLSAVRRVLGGGVIADRRTVALNLQEVTTDLETLLNATSDEQTIAIYTGEFLPEEVDDDWAIGARNEARAAFTASARRLAALAQSDGDHDTAAVLARRLIEVDRYDETAHQLLVQSLLATGDTAAARNAHQLWARYLSEIDVTIPPFEPTGSR
jgi:pimeloyl-ACP methyl ester carboxylesterase/DNA-binding SARP family transcriptional activator